MMSEDKLAVICRQVDGVFEDAKLTVSEAFLVALVMLRKALLYCPIKQRTEKREIAIKTVNDVMLEPMAKMSPKEQSYRPREKLGERLN